MPLAQRRMQDILGCGHCGSKRVPLTGESNPLETTAILPFSCMLAQKGASGLETSTGMLQTGNRTQLLSAGS